MMDNYFGFPISLPSVLLSYTPNGASCQEPLPYNNISKIMFSNNMAIKADWTLMEVDHRYNMDLLDKLEVDSTALLLPCVCTDTTINENTTNVRFYKLTVVAIIIFLGPLVRNANVHIQMFQSRRNSSKRESLRFILHIGSSERRMSNSHMFRRRNQSHPGWHHHGPGDGLDHGADSDGHDEVRLQ